MPDFDIDFCQDGRDRVIEYVRAKYGADSVSQIATFGTMAAKAVVRDVGRVLDLGYNFCDQLAKLIPFQPGKHITLKDAREMEPQLKEREKNEEEVRELLALAGKLEGLTRNVGMHAGGVLIAPGKLTDFCPLYAADGTSDVVVAVRQGRRRGGRAGQVRLPRAHHADDPRLDAALRASGSAQERLRRSTEGAARRRGDLPDAAQPETRPRCSSSNRAACATAQAREARPLRGHHRAGRALSPGPDGPDSRLHRAQARPRSASTISTRAWSRSSPRPTASWCTRSR